MSTAFTPNNYLRGITGVDTSALEAQIASLQGEVTAALNELEALEQAYNNLDTTVGGINTDVGQIQIDIGVIEADLLQAQTDLSAAQATLDAIPAQIQDAVDNVEASVLLDAQEMADLAEAAAIAAAAADATTKANTAKSEAIADAVAAAELEAQALADAARDDAIFQAGQLADLAEAAAIATASADAQAKADLAEAAAISAAEAEAEAARLAAIAAADLDSTAKADAAEAAAILAAESLAAAAEAAAIAAAALDATTKVNAAKVEAINDAVAQATTLANQAEADAIAAAALTAQEKADLAEAAAIANSNSYTDSQVGPIGSTITTIQGDLATVQATANGKNKVYYSTGTPGTTANVAGDLWYQRDASHRYIGQWVGTGGTSWQSTALTNAVIATLDAAKITTGTLNADRIASLSITADKIAAAAIIAGKIAADAVLANNIKAGEINTNHLVAGAVTAAKIAANTITAAEIAAGAITADELAANSVTAVKIMANAIEAGKIAAGAVVAGNIAANAVISESIAANAVTADHLDADSVTADAIAAGAIEAIHVSADAITTDAIAAGAITATEIATDAVTADKILAGSVVAGKLAADAVLANNIKAGEIGADHIAANSINTIHLIANAVTAAQIATGAVTTDKLLANAVTAEKIVSSAITTEKIALGVLRTNLMSNPSFEETYTLETWDGSGNQGPTNRWRKASTAGTVEIVTGVSRSGSHSLKLDVTTGGTEAAAISPVFPVSAGKTYRVTTYSAVTGSAASQAVQMYFNASGTSMTWFNTLTLTGDNETWGSVEVAANTPPLPADFDYINEATNKSNQRSYVFTPSSNGYAALRVMNFNPPSPSTLYIDDISVVELGTGGASELTAAGLRIFNSEGFEVGAFVSNRPNYFSVISEGSTRMSVNPDGDITANNMTINGTINIAGDQLLGNLADYTPAIGSGALMNGHLDKIPRGISSIGWIPMGVTWNENADVYTASFIAEPGRSYRIVVPAFLAQIGATNVSRGIILRYKTPTTPGGTTLGSAQSVSYSYMAVANTGHYTTLGPLIYSMRCNQGGLASGGELNPGRNEIIISTNASNPASVIVYNASGATGIPVTVEDIGLDFPSTGQYIYQSTPSLKQTYTTTWAANGSRTYNGNDSQTSPQPTDIVHGPWPGGGGDNRYGIVTFGNSTASTASSQVGISIATAMTGATVKKVEAYLYFNHWYYSGGGTAYIRPGTHTSLPSTGTGKTASLKTVANWPKPGAKWVDITTQANTLSSGNGIRSLVVGYTGTSSLTTYGRVNGATQSSKPQLRITYEK